MLHNKCRSACGEIIHVRQIFTELWSLTLIFFTHFSLSSQLLLHPCMDFPDSKTMLDQRWHRVVRLAYGWSWKYNVGQHCPYVNILSLAVGSITSWNQYVGPTLDQCTPVTCFNMTELRWVHYVGPTLAHSNTCTSTHCWLKGVGLTILHCNL